MENNFVGHSLKEGLQTLGVNYKEPLKLSGLFGVKKITLYFNHIPDNGGGVRIQIHKEYYYLYKMLKKYITFAKDKKIH